MTPGAEEELKRAKKELDEARQNFEETSKKAHVAHEKAKESGITDLPFEQWVYGNYARYRRDEETQKKAENVHATIYASTQGKIDNLNKYRQSLKDALSTT